MAIQTEPGFKEYLAIVIKRIWLVVVVAVLVVTYFVLKTGKQVPTYISFARVEVLPDAPKRFRPEQLLSSSGSMLWEFNTKMELLKGKNLANEVLKNLPPRLREEFGNQNPIPPGSLTSRLLINQVKGTNLVDVSFTGSDPVRTRDLVNLVVETFVTMSKFQEITELQDIRYKLENKLPEIRQRLHVVEEKLRAFREQHSEVALEERDRVEKVIRDTLSEELTKIKLERFNLEPKYLAVKNALLYGQDQLSLPVVAQSREIKSIKESIANTRQEMHEKGRKFGPQHPTMLDLQVRLDSLERNLEKEVKEILRSLKLSYEQILETEQKVFAALAEKEHELLAFNKLYNQFAALKDEKASCQKELDYFNDLISQTIQHSDLRPNSIRVVDRADTPGTPVSASKGTNLLVALLLGLAAGVGLAIFMEQMDDSIKTHDDVEKVLRLPCLGHVPYIKGDEKNPSGKDLVTHTDVRSTVSEAFRAIRTGLIFSHPEGRKGRCQVFLVTSAGPKEGKTTTAVNLAITMAHSGSRVLLIDADLRRPRIAKSFGLRATQGLTNYLAGAELLEQVVVSTEVNNLHVIPSGPLPPNPYELLGSAKMREMIARLRLLYDMVIFDTPPLVAVSDANILSAQMDGVIQIVCAFRSRRRLCLSGKEQIENVGGRIVGVILNSVQPLRATDYYYYSGYYKYYHYYREGEGHDS